MSPTYVYQDWTRNFLLRHDLIRAVKEDKVECAYTLRHSAMTDLVTGGLDLFTVEKISGTSVLMIEKHYGHLQRERARSALEKLASP